MLKQPEIAGMSLQKREKKLNALKVLI